jgi:hypothetical protein
MYCRILSLEKRLKEKAKPKIKSKINVGDRVLFKYPITFKKEYNIIVNYEANVVNVSDNQAKVIATSYELISAPDETKTDLLRVEYKDAIVRFMSNKWIDIDTMDLIKDERYQRNEKIENILNEGVN